MAMMLRTLMIGFASFALAGIAVACGGGGGGDGSAVIGSDGGSVTSEDGKLTLEIPPGALDEEVEITITAVSVDELPEPLREASGPGPAYQLEPDGLVFNEPVPVTLELNRSELDPEDGVTAYALLSQGADGELELLDNLVTEWTLGEDTVISRGELRHFSWVVGTKGPLRVRLESVARIQPVNNGWMARGLVENVWDAEPVSIADAKGTFLAFGTVSLIDSMTGSIIPELTFSSDIILHASGEFTERTGRFQCGSSAGIGSYTLIGDGTIFRWPGEDDTLTTNLRVVVDIVVECVDSTATPAPATSTPVPGAPTDTPAPVAKSTPGPIVFADPQGDEVVVGGGSDPAVDIRSVSIGPSNGGTMVFVELGANVMQSTSHFSFAVRITLAGQAGLVEVHDGSDNSAAPAGGSFIVGPTGVSMVFATPVPSGVELRVETFHLETAKSNLGTDTFTVILP